MKIFFDTEFTGLRQDTTLVSIGLISEDKRKFYAELTDFNWEHVHKDQWLLENVVNKLYCRQNDSDKKYMPNCHIGTKSNVARMLKNWLLQFDEVQLVSDVCHYDFVLFISLFGGAFDLPKNVSPYCYDINQDIARYYKISEREAFDKSREEILYSKYKENEISGDKHNALYDAEVIREVYQIVNGICFDRRA